MPDPIKLYCHSDEGGIPFWSLGLTQEGIPPRRLVGMTMCRFGMWHNLFLTKRQRMGRNGI
jgi:hypothetical protein